MKIYEDLCKNTKIRVETNLSEKVAKTMEILIISGLSGGGKSKAASYLEDMGFYIVDNMPKII